MSSPGRPGGGAVGGGGSDGRAFGGRAFGGGATVYFGGDYNPEQWPSSVWREDVALMRSAGVNLVTVGVFSWSRLQPAPDLFDFAWLDEVLDLLHHNGIGVCLATPTASPPPWFTRAHPDAMPVTAGGVRLTHGSRDTYCVNAPDYQAASRRIASKLADRYGRHPALRLWHVHNEYGTPCYCDHCALAFRRWLAGTYGDTGDLNDAWSTDFWSQRYGCFDEVLPPRATQYLSNPAHVLDYRRFVSDAMLAHYVSQRDILRRAGAVSRPPDEVRLGEATRRASGDMRSVVASGGVAAGVQSGGGRPGPLAGGGGRPGSGADGGVRAGVPVTTNFVLGDWVPVDHARWAREVDVVAVDDYPASVDDHLWERAFVADLARGWAGGQPWILMEHAPGAIRDDTGVTRVMPPGQARAAAETYVAGGATGVMYFQWRAGRGGAEQWHPAMVPQLDTLAPIGHSLAARTPVRVDARQALIYDEQSMWAWQSPHLPTPFVDYTAAVRRWHRALSTGTGSGMAGSTRPHQKLRRRVTGVTEDEIDGGGRAGGEFDGGGRDGGGRAGGELDGGGLDDDELAAGWLGRGGPPRHPVDVLPPGAPLEPYEIVVVPLLHLVPAADHQALRSYVANGGTLVLTFGTGLTDEHSRMTPGSFDDLLGVRLVRHRPGECGVWLDEIEPAGATVMLSADDRPLVTEHRYGRGRARFVAAELDDLTPWVTP